MLSYSTAVHNDSKKTTRRRMRRTLMIMRPTWEVNMWYSLTSRKLASRRHSSLSEPFQYNVIHINILYALEFFLSAKEEIPITEYTIEKNVTLIKYVVVIILFLNSLNSSPRPPSYLLETWQLKFTKVCQCCSWWNVIMSWWHILFLKNGGLLSIY